MRLCSEQEDRIKVGHSLLVSTVRNNVTYDAS